MFLALWAWCSRYGAPYEASLFGDYWSRFDRFLATFDLAGRYVRQPIEKEIPALTFKGFYRQWSDIMLTSDKQIGFRQKDFRFLQLQNLFELEMHYQVSPNIEITSVNHFSTMARITGNIPVAFSRRAALKRCERIMILNALSVNSMSATAPIVSISCSGSSR